MEHEAGLLAKLTEMRSRYGAEKSLVQKAAAENDIQGAMSRLQQVWEAYPDLRATEKLSTGAKAYLGARVDNRRPARTVQRLGEHL